MARNALFRRSCSGACEGCGRGNGAVSREDTLAKAGQILVSQVCGSEFSGQVDVEAVRAALGGLPPRDLTEYLAGQWKLRTKLCLYDFHPDLLPVIQASVVSFRRACAISLIL